MSKKGIILGAGITGLIWKFYFPEYELISPIQDQGIGGNFDRSQMVWIHDTYETRRLLTDLGWKDVEKLSKRSHIGYYHNGLITENLTAEINQILIQKKMTPWNEEIKKDFVPTSTQMSMTAIDIGVNYMNCLNVKLSDILLNLSRRCQITHGYAQKIEHNKELLWVSNEPETTSGRIATQYDEIISTIPAPFFSKIFYTMDSANICKVLRYETDELKRLPITNVIVEKRPPCFDDRYEMVYYDDDVTYSRASFINGKYGLEFTGVMSEEMARKTYGHLGIIDYFVSPMGRIISQNLKPPSENITFSGRFAQWNHSITTEYVIRQVLDKLEGEK